MPEGFNPANHGCCGVFSVATTTEIPFTDIWPIANFVLKKKANWRGSTVYNERRELLEAIGAAHLRQHDLEGIPLLEACYLARERDGNFIFDIPRHSLAFVDGKLIDQNETRSPVTYHRRYHTVRTATFVLPVENFDAEKVWEKLADPLDYL